MFTYFDYASAAVTVVTNKQSLMNLAQMYRFILKLGKEKKQQQPGAQISSIYVDQNMQRCQSVSVLPHQWWGSVFAKRKKGKNT